MNDLVTTIPPTAVSSVSPVSISAPGRGADLEVRVSVPMEGAALPVIIFSHGFGLSMDSYRSLTSYWASHGFAVIQPTHLDSALLGLLPSDPRTPLIWHHREDDIAMILDNLADLEKTVPSLHGRLDLDRIAVAGHSYGATTVSTFLGATHPDTRDGSTVDRKDQRVKAGVLLAVAGTGGANLTTFAIEHFGFMHPDFSKMEAPALIVAGARDQSTLSVIGPEWWREAYDQSPAPKALMTSAGGEHTLGGIAGPGRKDTTDENPERVATIQRLSLAFLRTTLHADNSCWGDQVQAFEPGAGSIEVK